MKELCRPAKAPLQAKFGQWARVCGSLIWINIIIKWTNMKGTLLKEAAKELRQQL